MTLRHMNRLHEHAEDIALVLGTVLLAAGCGLAFGYAYGLIAVGSALLAYGVWITERR